MINEAKNIFTNIQRIRRILNESVSTSPIEDAINENKYIYIYYDGEDTILKGYRTIRPYVLGTHRKSGNIVLRAWQENGSSDSYAGLTGRKRKNHEYSFQHAYINPDGIEDSKGGMRPGWRLFRLDGIKSISPTGRRFSIEKNKMPPLYKPYDKDIINVKARILPNEDGKINTDNLDALGKTSVVTQKSDEPSFDKQTKNFQRFFTASKKTRDVTKDEISDLYDLALKMKKRAPKNFIVVQVENGDMVLKDANTADRQPEGSVVGNLNDLYSKLVKPDVVIDPKFFNDEREKAFNLKGEIREETEINAINKNIPNNISLFK